MDEASEQLLYESRHADAKLAAEMTSEPSTTPHNNLPPSSTPSNIELPSPTSQKSSGRPMASLHSSLKSGKYSDLMITHGNMQWKAHKVVVCSQSSVLEGMIEEQDGTITLDLTPCDYDAVVLLMEYLYTYSYTTQDTDPDFSLPIHAKVFNLAISLGVYNLEALAVERYQFNLQNYVTNLAVYFASVRDIYATTTANHPGLRTAVVEAAIMEIKNLIIHKDVQKAFFELMTDIPEFQRDILCYLVENPPTPVQVRAKEHCDECGHWQEEHPYLLAVECNGCGNKKDLEFL